MFCILSDSAYAELPFNDRFVQPPEMKAPTRGTIAGELSSVEVSASSNQASTGSFQLKLPLSFPELRGPMLFEFTPSYSPSSGQSEWGMGLSNSIVIYRFNEIGGLDFKTDSLMSPWGLLLQGESGDYYPKGLQQKVRVRMIDGDEILAFLPDGSKLKFGGQARVITETRGTYSWYLSEVENAVGQRTLYHYETNSTGNFFLSEVLYAGRGSIFQYRVTLKYEPTPLPVVDYRSGKRRELDRRVIRIGVESLNSNSTFSEIYSYSLGYKDSGASPKFFLTQIQKNFPPVDSTERNSEPPITFQYQDSIEDLERADWEHLPHLDSLVEKRGAILSPDYSSQIDLNREGLPSFETRKGFKLIHIKPDSYSIENILPKPPVRAGEINYCRPPNDERATPRQFIPMKGPKEDYEVVDLYPHLGLKTLLVSCERNGELKGKVLLKGHWNAKEFTRLADLNHSGKPDLIKIFQRGYAVAPNISDEANPYRFGEMRKGVLRPPVDILGFWVLDMNGDGIPDLVAKTHGGLFIWFGKGNFEFETQAEFRRFKNASGRIIEDISEVSLSFGDFNHDGLTDIILSSHTNAQLFLNTGKAFVEKALPNLHRKLGVRATYPIVADLKGSGNTQIAIVQAGKVYVAELEGPSSGLLTSVDDGKGTRIDYQYKKAESTPGINQRMSLLSGVKVSTVGQKPVQTHLNYQDPQFHSKIAKFLGYDTVLSSQGTSSQVASYLHRDENSGLLISKLDQDSLSHVSRFYSSQFEDRTFDGIPYQFLKGDETGWINKDSSSKISSTQNFVAHDSNLCITETHKSSSTGILRTLTEYVKLPRFENHFACMPSKVELSSIHPDSQFDFQYGLKMSRNEHGQPTQLLRLAMIEGKNQEQVAQALTYNDLGDLISVETPAQGRSIYEYDSHHRISQILSPEGKKLKIDWDEVRDLPFSLSHFHGNADTAFVQFFRFNPLGLLSSEWNNLGQLSEQNPSVLYHYHYGDISGNTLSSIEERKLTDLVDGKNPIWSNQIEFLTGKGESVALAREGELGFSFLSLNLLDPEKKYSALLGSKVLTRGIDLKVATLDTLSSGLPLLSYQQNTAHGVPDEELSVIEKGVQQLKKYTASIQRDGLELTRNENSGLITTKLIDENENQIKYIDEAHQTFTYQYDVLNRLRKIILPESKSSGKVKQLTHTLSYDGFGNISLITRDEIGSVGYQYDLRTGLLSAKVYLDAHGAPVRSIAKDYDSFGRIKKEVYLSATHCNATPEEYIYKYDGESLSGDTLPGQIGFLTSVIGPNFGKEMKYRSDGKIQEQELRLGDGIVWRTEFKYRVDGSVSEKVTQISNSRKKSSTRVKWNFGMDHFGRNDSFRVNDKLLFNYQYNDLSEMSRILFLEGKEAEAVPEASRASELIFGYDDLTQKKNQILKNFRNSSVKFNHRWNLNSRGFIDRESMNEFNRSYAYEDPRGFVSSVFDQGKLEESFQYDSLGVVDWVQRESSEMKYQKEENTLKVGDHSYQMDQFGRVNQIKSNHYSYNGMGRVNEVVSFPKPQVVYG